MVDYFILVSLCDPDVHMDVIVLVFIPLCFAFVLQV